MTEAHSSSAPQKVQQFLQWFSNLEPADQDVLMVLVYREKKVRDVVKLVGEMGVDQRRDVFERLGLPGELVTRITATEAAPLGDAEVEWVDWKAPTT